ncbi:MAG: recombinase zinc beta ribbon domain-containing protein, partial [Steroidobacteraceae bacterium]
VRRADGKWLASAIHGDQTRGTGILNNRRYTGVVTWGRSKWTRGAADSSKRRQRQLEKAAVERVEDRLRIISDELWQRVKERQSARTALVGETIKGALRKSRPGAARSLLSGLLVCGTCGGKMWGTGSGRRHYVCGSHHDGGDGACENGLRVSQQLAEDLIVEEVLALIEAGKVDATVAGVKQRRGRRSEPVRRVNPELAKARARIADLEKMVATHVMTASEAEGPLSRARAAVEALEREGHLAPVVDLNAMAEEFRGWAGKLRRALGGADVGLAREALRQIVGQIVLRPHTERGERRALKPHETLDGKGIAAGAWENRYLVARFTRRVGDLPLHPVLTAEWFRAAGLSHQDGSGGRI